LSGELALRGLRERLRRLCRALSRHARRRRHQALFRTAAAVRAGRQGPQILGRRAFGYRGDDRRAGNHGLTGYVLVSAAGAARVEVLMFSSPTRRHLLGAGVFAAGSLLGIDAGLAQAPLTPTPACHDGDEPTMAQTAGPFFKPSSPERIELLDAGMDGPRAQPIWFGAPR